MMKKSLMLSIATVMLMAGCGNTADTKSSDETSSKSEVSSVEDSSDAIITTDSLTETAKAVTEETHTEKMLTITVNGTDFTARFYDTQAAEQFKSMLPLTFDMSELNGNEKYIYTDTTFTTSAEAVGHISKGEIMLYGDNCIVLFYDSFDTPYSYTRLGIIENAQGLENAVGEGSAVVEFSLNQE